MVEALLSRLHDWIAERLAPDFKLDRFQVLRRIKRLNKRLEHEMDRPVAESREHRWVLTRYVHRILGATKEEVWVLV